MSWKSLQAASAHCLLFSFTLLLALKLDHVVSLSWWFIFIPLWLFHALTAPSMPHDWHWASFHSVMATPFLVAFEILHLEDKYDVGFKFIFLPLLAFEVAILMSDEAIWETFPHCWVSISMVFFIATTTFTLLKLCGDVAALGWWDLFINFGIAECFAFLVCAMWSNQSIHRYSYISESSSSTMAYAASKIGGHAKKISFVILFMRSEVVPASARNIPILVLSVPLLLLQVAGVLFATFRLVEKPVLRFFQHGARLLAGVLFATFRLVEKPVLRFFQHGARLLAGLWSIDEGSREEKARLYSEEATGYNTFSPEVVKKMPKSELVEEIRRLQAVLSEQTNITNYSQQEYQKLQNEKILCTVCFDDPVTVVLIPCKHHVLCSTCSEKCNTCPICRVLIEDRMNVYNV